MTQEKKYLSARLTTKAFIFDPAAQKLLFARAADMEEEYWKLIGGRMEEGEEIESALKREIAEELGPDLKFENRGVIGTALVSDDTLVNITAFLVYYQGGEIKLNEEHSEYRWFTLDEARESEKIGKWTKPILEEMVKRMKEQEYLSDVQRLTADFENYKKRVKNDERELYGHLTAQIVTELIPVLDNFHAATGHVPAEAAGSPWVTGITYIEKQFEDVLANYGVTPLPVNPGDAFDPTRHEALDHKSTEGEGEKKLVIEKIVQKGYLIKDKLVRPAKVIVTEA